MKKIFIFIVLLLCGMQFTFASDITVNVYATAEGKEGNVGGQVKVMAATPKTENYVQLVWTWPTEWTTSGYTANVTAKEETGVISGPARIKLDVGIVDNGYYFDKWTATSTNSNDKTPTVTFDDSGIFELPNCSTSGKWYSPTYHSYIINIYGNFMKYRWGYAYPCVVRAIGGGSVSTDNDVASSKQVLEISGKTSKKKDVAIETVYYAHETESVEFVGWYNNADGEGEPVGTELSLTISYVPESTDGDNPSAIRNKEYYAVFRPKLMGYIQPCEVKISGTGEISVNNENWSSENISQNPLIGYVYNKNSDEKLNVYYYAKVTDETFNFLGWYDENGSKVSEALTYNRSYRPTAIVEDDLIDQCPPTLTAKFVPNNYYYLDWTTVEAINSEGGDVYVDNGSAGSVDGVSEWSSRAEYGSKESKSGYEFAYTYYAKPKDGFAFKEWVIKTVDSETGEVVEKVISDMPVYQHTVDYTNDSWLAGEDNPFTPPTLYARFIISRYYYHGRAKVGVADNSEAGSVFVSSEESAEFNWHSPTEDEPLYVSSETVEDRDGDGSTDKDVIETELNGVKYRYHYYAQPSETSAFVGWTSSSSGDNIMHVDVDVENNNHYEAEYYASEDKDNPSAPLNLYAVFRSYYHTLPRVVAVGSGTVKVDGKTEFQQEINNTEPIPAPANGNYYTYTYTLIAQDGEGASFLGWSTSDSEEDIVSTKTTYTVTERTNSTNRETPHRVTVYALFESDIKIKHTDRMIYYQTDGNEYINDVNVILEVANAATLKVLLSGDDVSDFLITNANLTAQGREFVVDATQSIIPLRLMYVGEDKPLSEAVGKAVTLTFTSFDNEGNPLASNGKVITIEEMPVVTFLPTDGKGRYVVSHTDGSGVSYTLEETSDQNVKIDVTHESKSYLQFALEDKEDDGMEFFAWQVIENYGTDKEMVSYLSYEMIKTYHFTKSVAIRPEFIPESWARYIVMSHPDMQYYDLNKAIAQARMGVNPDEKIVVVYRDGLLPKGEYTIPSGVTLLVPGEGPGDSFGSVSYLCQTNGALSSNDYVVTNHFDTNAQKEYKCFRKLIVEDGSMLNVNGTLCVSAKVLIAGQTVSALPLHFGHIELGNDVVINMKNGSTLYAWGYITNGNDVRVTTNNYNDVGRVVAEKGSKVWETFTFTDFRGGSATVDFVDIGDGLRFLIGIGGAVADQLAGMDVYGYLHEVFPINQYYVQNIEAPLILYSGAKEELATGVTVNGSLTTTSATLIDSKTEENGLFQWVSETARIIKFYDSTTDRNKYIVEDTQENSESRDVAIELGSIGLTLRVIVADVPIESKNYVLPIHSAMDLYCRNVTVQIPSGINIALMPGSTFLIDKNSKVINKAQCYVYDLDQSKFDASHGNGYIGSQDKFVIPIKARPYGGYVNNKWNSGVKVTRTAVNSDASLIVDGTMDCSNGYLITTEGGANITSNGGGKIVVGKFGSNYTGSGSRLKRNQTAFQYNQVADNGYAVGYHAIPLATKDGVGFYPMLHNNSETTPYTDAVVSGDYYYCDGMWSTSYCQSNVKYEDYTPRFVLTVPEMECWVGEGDKSYNLTLEQNNNLLTPEDWNSVIWDVTFTGRNANLFDEPDEQTAPSYVTFIPASEGSKIAVMHVKATYTRDGVYYVYSQAIDLVAKVNAQTPNTLAFADFSTLYVGQKGLALWIAKNSNGEIISISLDRNDIISVTDADNGLFEALKEGEVVVTINQAADEESHIPASTIIETITVKPRVVWNWAELYYPSVNTNPITMMDNSTNWTLEEEVIDYDVVQFKGTGPTATEPDTYTAEIYNLYDGEFNVKFIFKQNGYEDIEFISNVYRDLRYLRVDVNDVRTFNAITEEKSERVTYDDNGKKVTITSSEFETTDWTIHFLGIPDKLHFEPVVPQGDDIPYCPWQIEESANGVTWTTTFTWAYIPANEKFEYSLMPSTQYVRISYAAGEGEVSLKDVFITKMEGVKFYPEKVYMPASVGATKNVAVTYVSDVDVVVSPTEEFSVNPQKLDKTSGYSVENVVITNNNCTAQKLSDINITSSLGTEILPVQTYIYPQKLPIVLASDMPAERFYYVTPYMYNTTWDENSRIISMHNAVAGAQPYVTFYFTGVPTYISFNHNADMTNGKWIVEESLDGINWDTSLRQDGDVQTSTSFKKMVSSTTNSKNAKYIRLTYESLHTCKIDITDLRIIGEEGAFADPTELVVEYDGNNNFKEFTVTAINLANGMRISTDNEHFKLTHGANTFENADTKFTLTSTSDGGIYKEIFKQGTLAPLGFKVYFDGAKAVDYATITITNNPAEGEAQKTFATIKVVGVCTTLTKDSKFLTGVPNDYEIKANTEGSSSRELVITNTFADGEALFDYLYVFGETTTVDGTSTIKAPTSLTGSNAQTPCYIYKKSEDGKKYDYHAIVENANVSTKVPQDFLNLNTEDSEFLKVYITGYCPYASTGYDKNDEGVFFFTGGAGDDVHVYLEDCYLYSRAKTENGHFFENRNDGHSFTEDYVKGSGAVLVFECIDKGNGENPFNVTIHTSGRNLLKSHYGCFLESVAGRAFQASAAVQVHMQSSDFVISSTTILNFDDIWNGKHTNGFLSLQKQVNNAPSIDMGNEKTVVNFNGGQVELQNAQIVSTNYASTMAICHRSGKFAGILLAYGMGTDGTGGTVNFNDGTTTVRDMYVDPRFVESYLLDKDADGNYITNSKGEYLTTCLRTPANTFITGGSHCMMRACTSPTSSGGAPKDKPGEDGKLLGLYKYPKNPEAGQKGGWSNNGDNGLIIPTEGNVPSGYKVESVTPNNNGTTEGDNADADDYLNFWFAPDFEPSAKPEEEKAISFWKTCMTEIKAEYGVYSGGVGGPTEVEMSGDKQMEIIKNLMYCKIDDKIQEVILGEGYRAPVKNPAPAGDDYILVPPSEVERETHNYIKNTKPFQVEGKVYYITTATADNWMTFTAPFNVKNIYIMEAYSEQELVDSSSTFEYPRQMAMQMQAEQNAHFAAFFAVTVALGQQKDFETIYREYIEWGRITDKKAGLYESGTYNLRGKYKLIPYIPGSTTNGWANANFYLNHNNGNWIWGPLKDENGKDVVDKGGNQVYGFDTKWNNLTQDDIKDSILLHQGETYSMLFPYCVGCDEDLDSRTEWDYWSGKFLIFESTDGPHTINGSDYVDASKPTSGKWVFDPSYDDTEVVVAGNSTFAQMQYNSSSSTLRLPLYVYDNSLNEEFFVVSSGNQEIEPTTAFLYGYVPTSPQGMPVKSISYMGEINYGTTSEDNEDDVETGGHVPTINGGSDIFVTSIAEGINIAVSEPQAVGVFSATGQLIYSGWVETSVDVNLVVNGVYVVVGENNSVKILY